MYLEDVRRDTGYRKVKRLVQEGNNYYIGSETGVEVVYWSRINYLNRHVISSEATLYSAADGHHFIVENCILKQVKGEYNE